MSVHLLDREFTAKEVQSVLRSVTDGIEKIGLALLNYYSRTNLVPITGKTVHRGRNKYSYSDLILLCWLFRMKREGLPVNRFRQGIDYLRKKLPKLQRNPADMMLLTDGRQLFIKHRVDEKGDIAEALTGKRAGQYVWVYAIGSLIQEVERIIEEMDLLSSSFASSRGTASRSGYKEDASTHPVQLSEEGAEEVTNPLETDKKVAA